ncbi:wax ester/triacylglycerol synthase domain-containing protein [Moritella viscosa]
MEQLSLVETSFLLSESTASPKHFSGLQIFEPPKDYEGNFARDLFQKLIMDPAVATPFNFKLKKSIGGLYYWVHDSQFDFNYHIRMSMLPGDGSDEQLRDLVERLHSHLIDRSRPLWEVYLIEGLSDDRFAIFTKIHYAMADGKMANSWLSGYLQSEQSVNDYRPFWQIPSFRPGYKESAGVIESTLSAYVSGLKQLKSIPGLVKLGTRMGLKFLHLRDKGPALPFCAPRTPFSVPATRSRIVSFGSLPFERMRSISKITGVTLNDVILCCVDIGLNRYLKEKGILLRKPLVALGNIDADALDHLETIFKRTSSVKEDLFSLPAESVVNFSLLIQATASISEWLGISKFLPPLGSVLVSNVRGQQEFAYLAGAKLTEVYPVSVLSAGTALNITLYSYHEKVFFGLVGCKNELPDLDMLSRHVEAACDILSDEILDNAKQHSVLISSR